MFLIQRYNKKMKLPNFFFNFLQEITSFVVRDRQYIADVLSLDFNRDVKQLDDGLEITHSGDFSFILSPWTLVEGI